MTTLHKCHSEQSEESFPALISSNIYTTPLNLLERIKVIPHLGGGIHAKMPRWKNLEIIVQEYRSVTIAARPLPSLQLRVNRPAQNPWRCSASHR